MLTRRQIQLLHFGMFFDYVKLCSMMEASGEVVGGDLQTSRLIYEECGLFLDEGSLGLYIDRRAWRKDPLLSVDDLKALANSLAPRVLVDDEPYSLRLLVPPCHLTTQEDRVRAVAPAILGQGSNFGIGLEHWKEDVGSPRATDSADDLAAVQSLQPLDLPSSFASPSNKRRKIEKSQSSPVLDAVDLDIVPMVRQQPPPQHKLTGGAMEPISAYEVATQSRKGVRCTYECILVHRNPEVRRVLCRAVPIMTCDMQVHCFGACGSCGGCVGVCACGIL